MSDMTRLISGLALGAAMFAAAAANATTLRTIHTFTGDADGSDPNGPLVFNPQGTLLYGSTAAGAQIGEDCVDTGGCGIVYSLDPTTKDHTLTPLHTFTDGDDGADPEGALVFDKAGTTLYGTTRLGGKNGYGIVFSLDLAAPHKLIPLHTFANGEDGTNPESGLVFNAKGTLLYGTTTSGGNASCQCGTVFSLDPATRKLTTLHKFAGDANGSMPVGALVINKTGTTLYGTTSNGGTSDYGTIFSLDLSSRTLKPIYSFKNGVDGASPYAGVILNEPGTILYGTASEGGVQYGTIFSFNLSTKKLIPLHSFTAGKDGATPYSGLVVKDSVLYGTAEAGGQFTYFGTVFSFDLKTKALTPLHEFKHGTDDGNPYKGLVFNQAGTLLYGATIGTIFDIVP
jgi:uncharacterized repeat protein (TIGR03803 family)